MARTSMPAGGGGDFINSTTDSLNQSLTSLSAELVSRGIIMQFASSTNSFNFSSQKSPQVFYNSGCARLDLISEKGQSSFIFDEVPGYSGDFNPLYPSGANHTFYEQYFSTLSKSFKNLQTKSEGNPCDSTAFNCAFDPRDSIFDSLSIIKTGKVFYGKYHYPSTIPGFTDVAFAQDNANELLDDYYEDRGSLPACPTAYNCSQLDSSLYYYVYYPKHDYSACPLPVVFLFHAGGFSDCSQLNYENAFCYQIAQKGFVVINVEYRRGRIKDNTDGESIYTSVQQMMAMYRGDQDGRGAIRTMIFDQRNIATNHLPYIIDTNNIFIAGQSAGGVIACNVANYTTQGQIDSIFPSPAGLIDIKTALGLIDADFYRGTPDIEFYDKIKALWCMWGAYGIPLSTNNTKTEYEFLSRNGTSLPKPTISFLGGKDPVFPRQKSKQFLTYPPIGHEPYVTQVNCVPGGSYKVFSNEDKRSLRFECTLDLYKILKAHNIQALVYIDSAMYHGLEHNSDINAALTTNFGITSVTPTTLKVINNYMASRFTFFVRVVKYNYDLYSSTAGLSKFVNCEDLRIECSTNASHADCDPDNLDDDE